MQESAAKPLIGQRIALIQHCEDEGPGHILQWAQQRQHQLQIYRSDLGELPPEHEADGQARRAFILLGGPWSARDIERLPWMHELSRFIQARLGHCSFFGICLGGQLLAQALGAKIERLPQAETGWCQVTDSRAQQSLWALQWHHEVFHLPAQAQAWLGNKTWPVQGFRWSAMNHHAPVIALQFHPEWQVTQLARFIEASTGTLSRDQQAAPFNVTDLLHQQRFQHLHQWLEVQLDQWLQQTFHNSNGATTDPTTYDETSYESP